MFLFKQHMVNQMKAYKRILLPVDFSEPCKVASDRAREVADLYDAEVIMLHVIDYLPPTYVSVQLPKEFASKEFLLDKAKKHLAEWASATGFEQSEQIIETGQPKKAIVNIIESLGCDLAILAPHADSAFVRFFGSVTNAVAQNSNCDILVVRAES